MSVPFYIRERNIMKWINVNGKYLDYLRAFEKRIPNSYYGIDKYKPFFGVLFEKGDLLYITQVSHPKDRHNKLKQQKDFYKIYDPDNHSRLIAVVNLNYMFPIPKKEVTPFEKKKLDTYRTFKSVEEKSKYIDLLDKEIKTINNMNLASAAQDIYNLKYKYPNNNIAKRCLDFKMLEKYAEQWK